MQEEKNASMFFAAKACCLFCLPVVGMSTMLKMHVLDVLRLRRGRLSMIARGLGITPWAVSKWTRVPAERVLEVERITGIPRYELRPDIYPPPQ